MQSYQAKLLNYEVDFSFNQPKTYTSSFSAGGGYLFTLIKDNPRPVKQLGAIGEKLLAFVNAVDKNHPELGDVWASIFSNDEDLINQVYEVVRLIEDYRSPSVKLPFNKLINIKKISRKFLKDENFAPRLYKDKNKLFEFRNSKKSQIIKTDKIKNWQTQPGGLLIDEFARSKNPYHDHIQNLENRAKKYIELGCEVTAAGIDKEIAKFRREFASSYGFNRITIINAVGALAKRLGYQLYEEAPALPAILLSPLHEVIHQASVKTYNLIEHLDSFPEAYEMPIFDNFLVLHTPLSGCSFLLGEKNGRCYFINYFE